MQDILTQTITENIQRLYNQVGYLPSSLKEPSLQTSLTKLFDLFNDFSTFSDNMTQTFTSTSFNQLTEHFRYQINQVQDHIENIHINIAYDQINLEEHIVELAVTSQLQDIEVLEKELEKLQHEKYLLDVLSNMGAMLVFQRPGSFTFFERKFTSNLYDTLDYLYCVKLSSTILHCLYENRVLHPWLYRQLKAQGKESKRKAEIMMKDCKKVYAQFCAAGLRDIYREILPTYI